MTAALTSDLEILSAEYVTKPGLAASLVYGTDAGAPKHGWNVTVKFSDGSRSHYSLLDGADHWRHDAEIAPSGMVRFCHGAFSCLSSPADEMADLLDAAVGAAA